MAQIPPNAPGPVSANSRKRRSSQRITPSVVYRLAHGIEPQRHDLRRALGLPVLRAVPACAHCGDVHTAKRCPRQRQAPRKPRRRPTPRQKRLLAIMGALWDPR